MSLILSACVLFVSLKQSVNGAQFSNTISLDLFFGAAAVLVFAIDIVCLTNIYTSIKSHKLDIVVLNSI